MHKLNKGLKSWLIILPKEIVLSVEANSFIVLVPGCLEAYADTFPLESKPQLLDRGRHPQRRVQHSQLAKKESKFLQNEILFWAYSGYFPYIILGLLQLLILLKCQSWYSSMLFLKHSNCCTPKIVTKYWFAKLLGPISLWTCSLKFQPNGALLFWE